MLFDNWFSKREHKWYEEMRRCAAISRQTGIDMPIKPFPLQFNPMNCSVTVIRTGESFIIVNGQEFIDKMEAIIQDEIKRS